MRDWVKDDFLLVEVDLVRECLAKISIHKSMGSDGMCLYADGVGRGNC